MTKSPALVVLTVIFFLIFILAIAGCGGSTMATSTRQMQSLMVTPASADAQTFPAGQIQFTATATFNMAPMTVNSPQVMWSIGNPFPMATPMPMPMSMSQGASRKSSTSASASSMGGTPSVNANGLAQCNGFVGNVTVQATAPTDPSTAISQMSAMTPMVAGMAQMMCP